MGSDERFPPGETDAGPLLVVISGPSGVGKDSVLASLKERGLALHFTVTATTRPQREVNPLDHQFYTFLDDAAFEKLLAEDGLLEHAEVYGYHYGVPKVQLRKAVANGKDVIMRVDVQGAATIKRLLPSSVLIFLLPPSMEELERRINTRAQDDAAAIQRRLDAASRELAELPKFDYAVTNENDRLDDAVDEVLAIMTAERRRVGREPISI